MQYVAAICLVSFQAAAAVDGVQRKLQQIARLSSLCGKKHSVRVYAESSNVELSSTSYTLREKSYSLREVEHDD